MFWVQWFIMQKSQQTKPKRRWIYFFLVIEIFIISKLEWNSVINWKKGVLYSLTHLN